LGWLNGEARREQLLVVPGRSGKEKPENDGCSGRQPEQRKAHGGEQATDYTPREGCAPIVW